MNTSRWAIKLCCSSKSNDYTSNIHIPDALLYKILSRLPSKSLIRFRSVCKSWYTLIIRDHDFHKLHLLNFNSNNGPRWIGYQLGETCDYNTTNFWLYDESFTSDKIQAYDIHREETPRVDLFFSRIIGSCDGIVCLYLPVDEDELKLTDEWGLGKFLLCVWNPSIRKYKRIDFPWKSIYTYEFNDNFMMGFGLSLYSNEYKIVVICRDEFEETHVYIYSLRTDSWTETKAKPEPWKCKINKDYGTYFNGNCHWIRAQINNGEYNMLCFSLDTHDFRFLKLPPKSELSLPYDCFRTVVYKDMMAVWEAIEVGESFGVNILVMKEYGNCDSWLLFKKVDIKEEYLFQYRFFRLFGIDAGGRLLFKTTHDDSPLRACDSESGEIEEFRSPESVDIWDMAPYKESLVLLYMGVISLVSERIQSISTCLDMMH